MLKLSSVNPVRRRIFVQIIRGIPLQLNQIYWIKKIKYPTMQIDFKSPKMSVLSTQHWFAWCASSVLEIKAVHGAGVGGGAITGGGIGDRGV